MISLPRLSLAVLPTPLQFAPRLSQALGVDVWMKRDDLTGLGLGGNKVRKLEFLVADALADDTEVLVTGGGTGSNHVPLTAAAATRSGLACVAVICGRPPVPEPLNLRLTRLFGAELRFTGDPDRETIDTGIEAVVDRLRREGRRPYGIGRGGATPVGCLGYVEAAFELEAQLADAGIRPSCLVLATGSCGTQAGLMVGAALAGSSYELLGVTVSRPAAECVARVNRLAAESAALLGQEEVALPPARVVDGVGPAYGHPSPEGTAAAELVARCEGLLLDPAYTAKAMAVLVAEARAGRLAGPVVFLHTGGTGGLGGKA